MKEKTKEKEKIVINKEHKNEKQIKEIIKEEESEEDDEFEDEMESWDLLKLLVLTKSKKKTSFMGNFKNLLSSIIYNNKSFNDKLNTITVKYPIYIFDSKINNYLDINYSLFSFLYMSYRSGFFNMKYYGMGDFNFSLIKPLLNII